MLPDRENQQPKSQRELWDRVLSWAYKDSEFRQQLLLEPKQALVKVGILIPDELKIIVHETRADEVHILLPPAEIPPITSPVTHYGRREN